MTDDESQTQNLEGKVQKGFYDALQQLSGLDWLVLAGATAASALTAGIPMTLAALGSNLLVYNLLQRKLHKSPTSKGIFAEWIYANLTAPYVTAAYYVFNKIQSFVAKMLFGFGALIPFTLGLYFPIKSALHRYTSREFYAGLLDGSAIKFMYDAVKNNFAKAYKKMLFWLPLPLGAFWYFTPPDWQPILHLTAGNVGKVGFKAHVDKDIKEVYQDNVTNIDAYKRQKEPLSTPTLPTHQEYKIAA